MTALMKPLVLLAAIPMVTALASPASAAPDNLQRYVACLSTSRPAQVKQLLQASSAAAANLSYHGLANDNRCFARVFPSGEFRPEDVAFSQDLLRGRLAEQALLAQSGAVAALQPLPLQQKRYLRPWFVTTARNPAVDEMGACMADTDPAGIAALIKTDLEAATRARPSARCRRASRNVFRPEPAWMPVVRHFGRRLQMRFTSGSAIRLCRSKG